MAATAKVLRLRPFNEGDEAAAIALHHELKGEFEVLLGWDEQTTWCEYLREVSDAHLGLNLKSEHVRAMLLAADHGGELVGRVSVRFALNEFLAWRGGHIGYAVAHAHRRRGLATAMLTQALVIARAEGVTRVLMICDDTNIASATVIEHCGGVLERVVAASLDDVAFRRYWID